MLVYLEQLEQSTQNIQAKLQVEKKLFDRTSRRIEERLEEYNLLFGIFRDNIEDLFTALIQGAHQLIDNNTSFLPVLKRRITKEDDLLEERLAKTIKEIQLDKNLQEIFSEAIATFVKYRERIVREAKEDLETAITISEDSLILPSIDIDKLDIDALGAKIKVASEKGIDNFFRLGITSAATGVGGYILQGAASLDFSAFIISIFFGLLSVNALPRERKKAKQELETTFRNLQANYTNSLKETLAAEFNKCLQQFSDVIRPKQEELEQKINTSELVAQKVKNIRAEIQDILQEVETI